MLHAQIVPALTKWGVSPQADLVYRTLLTFGPWSVTHLSRSLDMRARLVRTALDELTEVGAAVPAHETLGTPPTENDRVWAGRAPAQVLALLRDRHHRAALARHQARNRQARMTYPDIVGDPGRLSPTSARPLHGLARTVERLIELTAAERHEHIAMNPEPAFSAASLKAVAPAERRLLDRGVTVLSLGVPASAEDESEGHDEELRFNGLNYRELSEVPGKLIMFDRTTALVPRDPSDRTRGMWEITAPDVVAELLALFLRQWDRATEPGRDWTPPMRLGARERTILVLLARGHTDAAIAKKLDISQRTIAYTMATLMDEYDVTNRFQLGLRLGAEAARQASTAKATTHEIDEEQHP
ncbi:LuxR C-terminal-related transcriptional regulator [Catellatospora coxensis]|uniref:HTH luxR-type domain-containing protein n=1 Tax=Catellatospora coxensis TaxID=310354 RepID=A0A8J3L288_9ACTN|nr:helix-turn-helix transcriptional regulator [Catellatospora coxensis]GIG09974.1 hypothetical protein Cco03nite_66740 [Catellatospora coxensis]